MVVIDKTEVSDLDRPILIFDLGGTLMEGPDISPASRFIRELEMGEESKDTINSFLFTENITEVDTLVKQFLKHFPNLNDGHIEKIENIWTTQFDDGFVLPGVFELLDAVRQADYRAGIISNIWHPYFTCFKNLFAEYLDLFDVVTLSHREGVEKPHHMLFTKTIDFFCQKFNNSQPIKPQNICMIGDSYHHDIAPALELGLRTVWVLSKPSREIQFLEEISQDRMKPAHLTVSTIKQLAGDSFPLLRTLMEQC
jgi:FMN phosphatase YigB (HAD superfamily)